MTVREIDDDPPPLKNKVSTLMIIQNGPPGHEDPQEQAQKKCYSHAIHEASFSNH